MSNPEEKSPGKLYLADYLTNIIRNQLRINGKNLGEYSSGYAFGPIIQFRTLPFFWSFEVSQSIFPSCMWHSQE